MNVLNSGRFGLGAAAGGGLRRMIGECMWSHPYLCGERL